MFLAFLTLLILLFSAHISTSSDYKCREDKWLTWFLYFITIIFIQLLRIESQLFFPDIPNYRDIFNDIAPIGRLKFDSLYTGAYSVDIGFIVFISICKIIFNNFDFFLLIISLLEIIGLYVFCKKCNLHFWVAMLYMLCMTYAFQIGILRQAIAATFFLIALAYRRNAIIYILLCGVGAFFHKSIIPLISIIFLLRFNISYKIYILIFCVSVAIYILQIDFVPDVFSELIVNTTIEGRIGTYVESDIQNSFLSIGFWDRLMKGALLSFIIIRLNTTEKNYHSKYDLLFTIGMINIILQMTLFSIPAITSRIRYYFEVFPLLFITEYVLEYIKDNKVLIYKALILAYITLQMYLQTGYLYLK